MNDVTIGLMGLAVLLILFSTGIEIGFAMAIVGFIGFAILNDFHSALNLLGRDFYEVITNYGYTVFPLFILMGQVAFSAGIAVKLYNAAYKFMGHIPGGLAMATVGGAVGFKSICGSSAATAATFSSVAFPEMNRYGYGNTLSTGVIASAGSLGCIIPPSVTVIVIGFLIEQSIGQLFLAGMLPGLIMAVLFIGVIYGWARINPDIAPRATPSSWNERLHSLPDILWVLLVFLVVVGGIMQGFFTPTEAGAVGTFAVLVLTIVKRDLNFKKYWEAGRGALKTAGMFLMLLVGSTVFGHFIAVSGIPHLAGEWIVALPLNRYLIMIFICLVYVIGGSFIDDLAFTILATPIFYPAVLKMGFHPLWFGTLIAVVITIGVIIPPIAACVFVVRNMTGVPLGKIYKGCAPFLISLVLVGALMFIFPGVALWLPSVFYK